MRRAPAGGNGRSLVREVGALLGGAPPTVEGVDAALRNVLVARQIELPVDEHREAAQAIADELAGTGVIGPFLRDDSVCEVMVNASGHVYVERDGRVEPAAVRFRSEHDVRNLIERVISPLGLRADATSPWVDARLPDGSRFHAVLPPIALGGPVVTIRKFSRGAWSLDDLIRGGSLTEAMAARLLEAVRSRCNILVCGGGGSGKTTLLGVLLRLVDDDERVITIEDAAELQPEARHVVSLETRPANIEGRGEVTMRDLVRCAMRMRADRIVVGEVRGPEALDMLQALTSGHAGSMCTVHADAPAEALMRLEVMALLGASGLSVSAARRQVCAAIDLVVHLERSPDGSRRVTELAEVRLGASGPELETTERIPR